MRSVRSVLPAAFLQIQLILTISLGSAGLQATDLLQSAAIQEPPRLCHSSSSSSDPAMDPFYETRHGQDVIWQIPPRPKAVLFLAHGKDKEPLSFFDPGPNCPKCYGFPEDRAAVLAALKRSYAVITVKSVEAMWLPSNVQKWPPPPSQDRGIVTSVIRKWVQEHSLEHLPLVAFGFSSGGNFTTLLTLDLDIRSMVVMCTSGEFEVLEKASALAFPPTLFVPMPRDNGSDGFYPKAVKAVRVLSSKGVWVEEVDIWPTPVRRLTFAEKIPCLEGVDSERIYAAYKSDGWLDEEDYLIKSPYEFDWKGVLWRHRALPFCSTQTDDVCLVGHVRQVIMAAWAYHSFSSWANEAIFNWLDETAFLERPS